MKLISYLRLLVLMDALSDFSTVPFYTRRNLYVLDIAYVSGEAFIRLLSKWIVYLSCNQRVTFCRYSISHPSDARVNMRVQTTSNRSILYLKKLIGLIFVVLLIFFCFLESTLCKIIYEVYP